MCPLLVMNSQFGMFNLILAVLNRDYNGGGALESPLRSQCKGEHPNLNPKPWTLMPKLNPKP